MQIRRKFTAEYKKEIVKLILEKGKSSKEVANDIRVHINTLNTWIRKYKEQGEDAFPGKGNLTSHDQEVYNLKKQIKDLEEENAILKKAAAIFANPRK